MTEPRRAPFIGVEPFDVEYGSGFQADAKDGTDIECSLVEDDGDFRIHRPEPIRRPPRLCFVDGVRRTEAHLTRTEGETVRGIAGAWGAGAVLIEGRAVIDRVETGRAVIFAGGAQVPLPDQGRVWKWKPCSVEGDEPDAPGQHLQQLMRQAEAVIGERLCDEGWLTVFDGPLHHVRSARGIPVMGYVKTHHRRLLAMEHWRRVPQIDVGERTGLFALRDDTLACYVRVGDPGPWSSPWAGIARIDVTATAGRETAVTSVDRAAGWLPRFASTPHRDPRAPVNLTPVAGLERRLHHLLGDAHLALRAVRDAVMELNVGEAA